MLSDQDNHLVSAALRCRSDRLSSWESEFLSSLGNRRKGLSRKQIEILDRILSKCGLK